ncbi:MAG: type II toxin-antitoxin system MqsA family antitoxin [Myxococcota bacterium]|nr:type II toxin-antitoxin system MqsA family antitoxin [Myxococcota bacterium]
MRCVICKHGETRAGEVTVTFERDGATVVVKGVPGTICGNCGEEYLDEAVAEALVREADRAAAEGVQVDVRRYVAA